MNRIESLTRYFDNLANPILVKEIRQAVRGKFLIVVMGLILVAQLIIWWVITLPNTYTSFTGRDAYIWMLSLFGSALGLTMPIYAGFRILSERAKQDLLYVSALSPFQIIWGKFLSSASIILIVFTTFLPFFYLTLLIGGIDTWTITYSLIVVVMALLGGVMFTILTLCPVVPILVKLFLIVVTLVGLYMINALAVVTLIVIMAQDIYISGEWERFFAALYWLIGGPIAIGLLTVLAACAISPASSNRAFIPRIYATATVLLAIPFTLITFYSVYPAGMSVDFTEIAFFMSAVILFWTGMGFFAVSASGRFQYGIRLRRQIPKSSLRKILAFPFYSGAANGVVWSLLFIGTSLLLFAYLYFYPNSLFWDIDYGSSVYHFISYFNYVAIYLWAGMILSFSFGRYRPGLWTLLLCGLIGGITSVFYLSFLDVADESILILLPNAPAFFRDEIYMVCFGSSVVNFVMSAFVFTRIIIPQTFQYFRTNNSDKFGPSVYEEIIEARKTEKATSEVAAETKVPDDAGMVINSPDQAEPKDDSASPNVE